MPPLFALMLLVAQSPTSAQEATRAAVIAAYHTLAPADIESHPIDSVPKGEMDKVDVSAKVRSASFGHTTTLLIPKHPPVGPTLFYVQYGRSTNSAAATFGPFKTKQ